MDNAYIVRLRDESKRLYASDELDLSVYTQ